MMWSLVHVILWVLGTIITAHPDNARQDCVFPFTFDGVEYNECAPGISQSPRPWCATSLQPDRKNVDDWDYCSVADSDNVTPVTTGNGNSLLPANCVVFTDYVFGGDELPVESYQWMALIGYGKEKNPYWGCGGSLISQRYVITAAHCADKQFTGGRNIVLVRLGEHDISTDMDCQYFNRRPEPECAPLPQDFNISPNNIIMHPHWDNITLRHDIALIRLDQPAELHGYVQPICLPPSNSDVSSFLNRQREAEVAGWGATKDRPGSNVRRMVALPFVPLETCKTLLDHHDLHKGQVCFGGVKGKDSCNGDSGGPLVGFDYHHDATSYQKLLGVVSYGLSTCATENLPAVYTDVAHYRNWIEEQLKP